MGRSWVDITVFAWAALLWAMIVMAAFVGLTSLWHAGTEMQAGALPLYELGVCAKSCVVMSICRALIIGTAPAVNWLSETYWRWEGR